MSRPLRRRGPPAVGKIDGEARAKAKVPADGGPTPGKRRSFHEAAHKLGPAPGLRESTAEDVLPDATVDAATEGERDVIAHAGRAVLALGALGIVYGDIGTSPLYTENFIFTQPHGAAHATPAGVFGVVSLIFWALMIEVSIKYAGFIMRAHNRGDGGIMALTALIMRKRVGRTAALVLVGIFGASLFFGDGMITPAISVLGALQGLQVDAPALRHLIVPLSLVILIALFVVQRRGSGTIGWIFGPVMVVWFVVLGALGAREVIKDPAVFQALSPSWGARFLVNHGGAGFLVLGGVVLAVTGAEALYADRGHFGSNPIRIGWFGVALPALVLNYLGQGVLIIQHPRAVSNPFFLMVPEWGRFPMLLLATAATIIASQAVISGSFSVAKQAVQLGFLPRLKIQHTSKQEGQIYVPFINWGLCIGVAVLVLVFKNSNRLGDMYGVAVTGTFMLNTLLFVAVARSLWGTAKWKLALIGGLFLTVEIAFFTSNLTKIAHGAWLPLAVGLLMAAVMVTWRRGAQLVTRSRTEQEGDLGEFLEHLAAADPPVRRVPGTAIFLNPGRHSTPLALRAAVEHAHAMHEKVLIVSVETISVPHIDRADQFVVARLGRGLFRVFHVIQRIGYQDSPNVPEALSLCRKLGLLDRNLDLEHASYFVSRITITPTEAPGMAHWRKQMFITMARNAANPIEHFGLPSNRTVIMGSQVAL
jgi:KUP system potassium uptake protein